MNISRQGSSKISTVHLNRRLSNAGGYFLALLYAVTILIPLYFVLISSFKENAEIFSAPLNLPQRFSFDNYILAQERVNILQAMGISAVITILSLLLNMGLAIFASYAIARIKIRSAKWAETFFSTGFLIPVFAVLVPVFLLAARTGLLYNPIFLILFYAGSHLPIAIVILTSQMRQIPKELEDAAHIDGANHLQIILHIFIPLSKPAMITVLVLNFIAFWNEYIFALILLAGDTRTVQLVVPLLRSERLVDYGLVSAGIMMSVVPIYIIFILFQEQVVSGLMGGAIKN